MDMTPDGAHDPQDRRRSSKRETARNPRLRYPRDSADFVMIESAMEIRRGTGGRPREIRANRKLLPDIAAVPARDIRQSFE
jgi:hypothetical protein